MIYTFWEGKMPEYIKLCMETWKFDYTVLNYGNLKQHTDFDIEGAKRFTLPQIADCVRVHVLRDNGGYWLDTDTICVTGKLPEENMVGNPETRTNTIGFLHTVKHSEMYERWADYQDVIIARPDTPQNWDVMGNAFTDKYIRQNRGITVHPVDRFWPETYMIESTIPRNKKYGAFYFDCNYHLSDILKTDMLMLHNSWTPGWYKELTKGEVLARNCTLSNILNEVLCDI